MTPEQAIQSVISEIQGAPSTPDGTYPKPLKCSICGVRNMTRIISPGFDSGKSMTRFITAADPLPEGWHTLTDPTCHFTLTYCPSCYQDKEDGRYV